MSRPWCACARVRIADKADQRIQQTEDRIRVHAYLKCVHYRAGVAAVAYGDMIMLKVPDATTAKRRRARG